jgi:ribosomal protein S18 acetylase RimI-like enzyme
MELTFRTDIRKDDPEKVREIVTSTGFFYDFEIEVAVEIVVEALEKGVVESGYYFIFADAGDKTVGFACTGPIACTVGSYDLFWIAVHGEFRGSGIGKKLLSKTHQFVKEMNGRILVAETSGTEKYVPTREFYLHNGYTLEAQIKDFYLPGDDKMMYIYRL